MKWQLDIRFPRELKLIHKDTPLVLLELIGTFFGLPMLVMGANFLVDGAAAFAKKAGISGHVIGLTLVAAATSLPGLFTSTVATERGEYDIAVGNIIGSSAFNITVVLGMGVLLLPGYAAFPLLML